MELRDAQSKITRALPASTSAVTATAGIDTGKVDAGSVGYQEGDFEFLLSAPAVTTGQLPDTKLFTYDVIDSENSDLSSPRVLMPGVMVQTGAGGAGAAANTYRFRIPSNGRRYVGMKITPSASGTGDASAATATLEGLF